MSKEQKTINKKQRVLLISHAYIAPENRRKLECLAEVEGLEVGVVCPRVWQTKHGTLQQPLGNKRGEVRYEVFALGTFFQGNGARYFYNPLGLLKALWQFKPQIVHLEEEPWSWVAKQVAKLGLLFRFKLVVFTWENLEVPMSLWQRRIERFVLSRASLVIAGNQEAGQRVKRHGFRKSVEVLPQFGVDPRLFKPQPVPSLKKKLGLKGLVVGFVGRPVEEKGIKTLLQAVAKLPQASLLLVTSSPELPIDFRKMFKALGLGDRVVAAAGISHADLPKYYSLMDVLVLPSQTMPTWKEQFGRVLIEAMACKIPVIGSSSGAIPEVVGGAGLIFKEGDTTDLCAKIKQLQTSTKQREGLAEKGYRRVLENFTFEKIATASARHYRKLAVGSA